MASRAVGCRVPRLVERAHGVLDVGAVGLVVADGHHVRSRRAQRGDVGHEGVEVVDVLRA